MWIFGKSTLSNGSYGGECCDHRIERVRRSKHYVTFWIGEVQALC